MYVICNKKRLKGTNKCEYAVQMKTKILSLAP